MPQNTEQSPARCRVDAPVGQGRESGDSLRPLIDRLRRFGFGVPPFFGKRNNVAGGVPMRFSVRDLLRSGSAAGKTINTILTSLDDQTPLTLSLADLGKGEAAISNLQRFCEYLEAEIARGDRGGEYIGVCVHSHEVPLQAFRIIAKSIPGNGPRYVLMDDLAMSQHSDPLLRSETDRNWPVLWRDRLAPAPLRPAYGATVRSGCPLLADEAADSVLPVSGIQVPAESAWLPLSLPLPYFANDSGEIRWHELLPALRAGVALAERIMELLCWPQASQQSDARLNRRLAMSITGLGDLVFRRGLDPENLATLRWLSAIVVRIRKSLWHCSGQLARTVGCLPALCSRDPSSDWHDNAQRETWRRHWRAALERSAVRHRNMLVLSPYSVLPSSGPCHTGYTDLLPVVACADAWSFAEQPEFAGWSLDEYKVFHRRAWAVIRGRKDDALIAAGV